MRKMTENEMRNIGGGKHYYVYKCSKGCAIAYQYSWAGKLAFKLHNAMNHGGKASIKKKDVCVAMGNPCNK